VKTVLQQMFKNYKLFFTRLTTTNSVQHSPWEN